MIFNRHGVVAPDATIVLMDLGTRLVTVPVDGKHGELPRPADLRLLVVPAGRPPSSTPLDLDGVDLAITPMDTPAARLPGVVGVADTERARHELADAVGRHPVAAWSLAQLLRATSVLGVSEGLAAESATYSTLLAGVEFADWLARRGTPRPPDAGERVSVERVGDDLFVTLDRPARRNAYDALMRDALVEALDVARLDSRVRVLLRGNGPDFCAGGDLDEFGTATDVAFAHRLRVVAGGARAIEAVRDRVTARVHGNAIGSGIELAAFAGRVLAAPNASFGLPEVGMGLVPGAGGTVSITRRIGRHRTLWWALSGERIDVGRALQWGLVDALA